MIGIGGKTENSNIEVHDLRFVIAENIDETHEMIKNTWFGIPSKLHMDSYTIIDGLDNHRIHIKDQVSQDDLSLYMVNFGGYIKEDYFEWHDVVLVLGLDEKDARKKAMDSLSKDVLMLHVDQVVSINEVVQGEGYIHLETSHDTFSLKPTWQGYTKIK